jgi:hypothetical protein
MSQTKESWTRIGIISAIACTVAGILFGLAHVLHLDLLGQLMTWVLASCLAAAIYVSLLPSETRPQYMDVLLAVAILGALSIIIFREPLRGAICAAFSEVVYDVNNLSVDPRSNPSLHADK